MAQKASTAAVLDLPVARLVGCPLVLDMPSLLDG